MLATLLLSREHVSISTAVQQHLKKRQSTPDPSLVPEPLMCIEVSSTLFIHLDISTYIGSSVVWPLPSRNMTFQVPRESFVARDHILCLAPTANLTGLPGGNLTLLLNKTPWVQARPPGASGPLTWEFLPGTLTPQLCHNLGHGAQTTH